MVLSTHVPIKSRHWEHSHEVSKEEFKVSLGHRQKTCLVKPKLAGQTKPEPAKENKRKLTKVGETT